jgi:hypothetical protein
LHFELTDGACQHCFAFVFVLISSCPQEADNLNKNKDESMTVYEDEWAFWDDIAGKYILKHAGADHNVSHVIEAASTYADRMVIARRKRKSEKVPGGEVPRMSASATAVVTATAV